MGIIFSDVVTQESLGSGLSTIRNDLDLNFVVSALHNDFFALKETGTAATIQNLVDKITSIQVSTIRGQPESTVDTDQLFDMMPFIEVERYYSNLTDANNTPHAFGIVFPLSPFPNDLTRNFGSNPGQLTQWVLNTAADVSQDFDGFTHDLIAEGLSADLKPNSLGYLKTIQDSFSSGAVDSNQDTEISGLRLLATMNFQTTAFDDLAAAAAVTVTGIRTQSVMFSNDVVYGPYRPAHSWTRSKFHGQLISGTANVGNQLDIGHFLADYGWMDSAPELGINIENKAVKIRTTAGVSSEATIVSPWALVKNGR